MARTRTTTTQARSTKVVHPFESLDLAEQLRLAMPIARALIQEGITSDPLPGRNLSEEVINLTGSDLLRAWDDEGEDSGAALANGFAAARAIGIALGLLLRPEAVRSSGGAR
jgi:hypothetical protein